MTSDDNWLLGLVRPLLSTDEFEELCEREGARTSARSPLVSPPNLADPRIIDLVNTL